MDDAPSLKQRIYEMLMESQYWPPETMQAYQRSQLASLLRHARATVPFYRTRLDPVFRKNGGIDWDRWHEIPIVTRADLRDRRAEMLAAELPPGHGPTKTFHSSGSSGVPISVEVTGIWTAANQAAIFRFLENQKIDLKKTEARLSNRDSNGTLLQGEFQLGRWGRSWAKDTHSGQEININRNLPEDRKLQLLEAYGVSYLRDITINAEFLAAQNLIRNNPVKLEAIFCIGQAVTDDQRSLFQKSFGARSLSAYSSKEGGLMGSQCGNTSRFHVNSENVFVEILAANGNSCAHNQSGRVVITPFFSTALPLIRYDQGDAAVMLAGCDCNSRLPVLGHIEGRQDQLLQLPDGKRAVVGLDYNLLREGLNALAFQLAQVAPLILEIRYVPVAGTARASTNAIVAHIHELVHPGLEVVFKSVEKIPLNSGGKQQRIVCEVA